MARTGRHVRIRSIEGGYLITSYYNGSENFADTSSNNSPYPCHFIVDNKRNVSLYFPSYIDSVVVKDTIYVTKKVVQNDVTSFELYKNGIYFSKIKDPLIYDDFQNLNGDPKEIEINAKKYSRILNGVY